MKKAQTLTPRQLVANYIEQVEALFDNIEGDQIDYRGLLELRGHLQTAIDRVDVSSEARDLALRIVVAIRDLQNAIEDWRRFR